MVVHVRSLLSWLIEDYDTNVLFFVIGLDAGSLDEKPLQLHLTHMIQQIFCIALPDLVSRRE